MTRVTGPLLTYQRSPRCRDFEMRYMECLDAYGIRMGRTKCKDYMEDLRECANSVKTVSYGRYFCKTLFIYKEISGNDLAVGLLVKIYPISLYYLCIKCLVTFNGYWIDTLLSLHNLLLQKSH
ncbi:UNVERIFIED_CONTAM: hypothetical protein GTU68_034499 [Idotea baltica]|nr:hypothetical protein [Idotea baltica]